MQEEMGRTDAVSAIARCALELVGYSYYTECAIWRRAEEDKAGEARSGEDNRADPRLVAQVHPPDRDSALPPGASGAVEGQEPDLGHPGMYASFGYEDLDDLFPWIELKQSGTGGHSRRSGLGFD